MLFRSGRGRSALSQGEYQAVSGRAQQGRGRSRRGNRGQGHDAARLNRRRRHIGRIARGRTDANGLFGFATPSDTPTSRLALSIRADGFNSRHLLLDGTSLGIDLRAALYF